MSNYHNKFNSAIDSAYRALKDWGQEVPVSRWQGVETEGTFREITFFDFTVPMALKSLDDARKEIKPNLPWADDHFAERVGGQPLNPGDQYKNWPYWREEQSDQIALKDGLFSHTYMERFWPQYAGKERHRSVPPNWGIRFRVGDLHDVVRMLFVDPFTRQAYVPIWFPEDTGAVHGERVPCSIGYYFLMRRNSLHMRYHIRSCDFNRYLRDDIYMAVRLQLWMLEQLQDAEIANFADDKPVWHAVRPGNFHMHIDSLHILGRDFAVKT